MVQNVKYANFSTKKEIYLILKGVQRIASTDVIILNLIIDFHFGLIKRKLKVES